MNADSSSRLARWAPISALSAGVVGISLWMFAVRHALPRTGATLDDARALGLVSWTTVNGYDVGQESLAWLLGCLMVPVAVWLGWVAVRSAGDPSAPEEPEVFGADELDDPEAEFAALEAKPPDPARLWPPPAWVPWVTVAAVMLSVLLRPGIAHGPNPWGSFGLLGEEGVYLGAVQAMRTGRTLYTDLAFPYGPLLIQPFDWWLRIAGDTVVAARWWVLFLHSLGVGAVALTVASLTGARKGPWAAAAAAVAMAAVMPPFLPVLNSALLRPALALLPAALLIGAARDEVPWLRRPWRILGVTVAGACLLSFEVAGVAVLSTAVALFFVRPPLERLRTATLWAVGAGVLGLLPLTFQGGLGGFFAQAWEMVRLPSLGYQALPYPDVAGVFRDAEGALGAFPPDDTATAVWAAVPPLVLWGALGAGLCGLGRRNRHATTALFVAAFAGAALYRGALGRSDLYHLWFYGAVPVVVLLVTAATLLWDRVGPEVRAGLVPAVVLCVVTLGALDTTWRIAFPLDEEVRLAAAAGMDEDPLAPRTVELERSGALEVLPRLADQVQTITRTARDLPDDDGVWFYPSEAAYYFLADRAVPLRYLWAYDAATPAMQQAAISDLQASRPRWVFRSSDTFAIDHIPQEDLVPLVDAFLARNYRPVRVLPGATLFEATTEAPR